MKCACRRALAHTGAHAHTRAHATDLRSLVVEGDDAAADRALMFERHLDTPTIAIGVGVRGRATRRRPVSSLTRRRPRSWS